MRTLDNAQGLNLRRGRSLGGKRTADINDELTDGFLDENLNELKLRMKIRKKTRKKTINNKLLPRLTNLRRVLHLNQATDRFRCDSTCVLCL